LKDRVDILVRRAEGSTTNDSKEILILRSDEISYRAHFRI